MNESTIETKIDKLGEQLAQLLRHVAEVRSSNSRLEQRMDRLEQRIGGLEQRMDGLEQRMDGLDQRMDGLDKRMDGLDKRMDGLEQRMDGLDKRMDGLDQRMDGLDQRMDGAETRATKSIRDMRRQISEGFIRVEANFGHFSSHTNDEVSRVRWRVENVAAESKSEAKLERARFDDVYARLERVEEALSLK